MRPEVPQVEVAWEDDATNRDRWRVIAPERSLAATITVTVRVPAGAEPPQLKIELPEGARGIAVSEPEPAAEQKGGWHTVTARLTVEHDGWRTRRVRLRVRAGDASVFETMTFVSSSARVAAVLVPLVAAAFAVLWLWPFTVTIALAGAGVPLAMMALNHGLKPLLRGVLHGREPPLLGFFTVAESTLWMTLLFGFGVLLAPLAFDRIENQTKLAVTVDGKKLEDGAKHTGLRWDLDESLVQEPAVCSSAMPACPCRPGRFRLARVFPLCCADMPWSGVTPDMLAGDRPKEIGVRDGQVLVQRSGGECTAATLRVRLRAGGGASGWVVRSTQPVEGTRSFVIAAGTGSVHVEGNDLLSVDVTRDPEKGVAIEQVPAGRATIELRDDSSGTLACAAESGSTPLRFEKVPAPPLAFELGPAGAAVSWTPKERRAEAWVCLPGDAKLPDHVTFPRRGVNVDLTCKLADIRRVVVENTPTEAGSLAFESQRGNFAAWILGHEGRDAVTVVCSPPAQPIIVKHGSAKGRLDGDRITWIGPPPSHACKIDIERPQDRYTALGGTACPGDKDADGRLLYYDVTKWKDYPKFKPTHGETCTALCCYPGRLATCQSP